MKTCIICGIYLSPTERSVHRLCSEVQQDETQRCEASFVPAPPIDRSEAVEHDPVLC